MPKANYGTVIKLSNDAYQIAIEPNKELIVSYKAVL
jgi:hypothetical protein